MKRMVACIAALLFLITSCGKKIAEQEMVSSDPLGQAETGEMQSEKPRETPAVDVLDWPEITEKGIEEQLFLQNLDAACLEKVAKEFQTLVEEEVQAEQKNPQIVLSEGWVRVFDSPHYQAVLDMGEEAMKPLYWIIYKSEDAGLYEYLCAAALSELSGFDFTDEEGLLTWKDSKEFLERFDEKVLDGRKR